ncbi:YaaL family protein [Lacticaseibacillus daqingensis]|uniref:YaaL family protein n=1 Tax=Lacticaseibacillus daqingensis TaxID=2486014 RepID=UPI000F7875C9|nr:YaaL family protein [Lacticaseibacillus daqingensis]
MFFKKRPNIKEEADRELMQTVGRVREHMASQRKLVATFREVDEATRSQISLQEGLFDFLHREARTRQVSGKLVAEMAAQQLQAENQVWQGGRK